MVLRRGAAAAAANWGAGATDWPLRAAMPGRMRRRSGPGEKAGGATGGGGRTNGGGGRREEGDSDGSVTTGTSEGGEDGGRGADGGVAVGPGARPGAAAPAVAWALRDMPAARRGERAGTGGRVGATGGPVTAAPCGPRRGENAVWTLSPPGLAVLYAPPRQRMETPRLKGWDTERETYVAPVLLSAMLSVDEVETAGGCLGVLLCTACGAC